MKKTLYDISWKVDEPTYRAGEGLSYSTLSRFHREGFNKLDSLFDPISGPYLTFGSVVDTLLTGDKKEFKDRFCVAEFPTIPPSMEEVVNDLFIKFGESKLSLNDIGNSKILESVNRVNYQKNWNDDTRVKKILDNCSQYYDLLVFTDGKEIISSEDYNDAVRCKSFLENSEATSHFFTKQLFEEDIDREFQLKFRGEYNGIPIRCMADVIIVDHKNKKVIPVDLKTSSKPEYEFPFSFTYWGYYIQAQMYWYIIRQNMDKDDYFKDFELTNYHFVVISRHTLNPLVWNYPDTKVEDTVYYGNNNQFECKNWRYILEELYYYLNDKPLVPKGIIENKPNDIIEYLNNI